MSLQVSIRRLARVIIVDLQGRATIGHDNDFLKGHLRKLIDDGDRQVLLNLSGLLQVDSSSLRPSWNIEDGTDNFAIGIRARVGEKHHFLTIYTHYFDAPPEPKEMYPPNCWAIGTLEISSSEPLPREALEVCGTPERWMVHHSGKWVPLSASYVAFLMGINQKLPDAT